MVLFPVTFKHPIVLSTDLIYFANVTDEKHPINSFILNFKYICIYFCRLNNINPDHAHFHKCVSSLSIMLYDAMCNDTFYIHMFLKIYFTKIKYIETDYSKMGSFSFLHSLLIKNSFS